MKTADAPAAMTINHKPPAILAFSRGDPLAIRSVMVQNLVAAIIFSTGKNGSIFPNGAGVDEQTNVKQNGALSPLINPVFVFHTRTDSTFANGEFDDQLTWITAGELYGKLIAAGVLP